MQNIYSTQIDYITYLKSNESNDELHRLHLEKLEYTSGAVVSVPRDHG